jgi:hypothetical protein
MNTHTKNCYKWFLLAIISLATTSLPAFADEYVHGYTRSNGTYVQPHYRSSPNSSNNDNWIVKGNTNPHTGQEGTQSPTWNDKSPSSNKQIYGNPGYQNSNSSNNSKGY